MGASITDNINKEKDILISKTGIPSKHWVADSNQTPISIKPPEYS